MHPQWLVLTIEVARHGQPLFFSSSSTVMGLSASARFVNMKDSMTKCEPRYTAAFFVYYVSEACSCLRRARV
jgi:hypothetical protein